MNFTSRIAPQRVAFARDPMQFLEYSICLSTMQTPGFGGMDRGDTRRRKYFG